MLTEVPVPTTFPQVIPVNIDAGSHIPIYLQIAEGLRGAIAAGVFQPNDSLPSLRALALRVQVNPNTVQRAYEELLREGIVYSQRGRGIFVATTAADSAQSRAAQTVRAALDEAIRTARAAGMSTSSIRSLFSAALQQSPAAGVNRHE